MKSLIIAVISLYQHLEPSRNVFYTTLGISPRACRYQVSCSQYTKTSIIKYGTIHGLSLGFKRFLTCHPFSHKSV